MFLPILQFPVFLGMSWNLREMLGIPGGTLKSLFGTMLGREALSDAKAAQQAALSFEPTMMEEGLPWAIDLTVADPTGTLSYGVAVIMASQVLLGMRGQSGRISMLSRVLLLLSMSIGPLMASAPTGILYYWACSSGFALITNVFLDWKYPLVRFAPCKRPLLTSGLKPK
jgi:membrane protein insertase Oxa1/YidC/SpoIIIJ